MVRKKSGTEMYSTHNEWKPVIAKRFIRALTNKIYKYMTSESKNVCIDTLDDIVNKYNNTYHSTIKKKPVNVKSNKYIYSSKKTNDKIRNWKLLIVLEYQNIFSKVYTPNWSEEDFVIIKVKNTVLWTYIISDLNGEEIVGTFYKNELQSIQKVIKGKGDLYAI